MEVSSSRARRRHRSSQFVNRLSAIQRPTLLTPDGVSLSLTVDLTPAHFHPRHLAEFERAVRSATIAESRRAYGTYSRIPSLWAAHIAGDGEILNFHGLPTERLDRQQLFSKLATSDLELREKCALIFAWGGMKIDHGKSAFRSFGEWRHDVECIQAGSVSRAEAYAALLARETPGMGPAFFTKLIYFFGRGAAKPGSSFGYIMDQWTARSVNLLAGERMVALSAGVPWPKAQREGARLGKVVAAENSADKYEAFCQFIDCLASRFECAPDFVEEVMFSHGGHSKGRWRIYVLENDV
ncbi:hypothetical protein RHECIAT_CH0000863 [Rhizobium etli CIAT 652]|uniref:Uncharacterized protein n=1 Tax=Rhizobium etli (strain CIAT 652) TaxID=491916 RepID=B3PQK3_RHIE6|nr:hypothetical protein RHECIAT_CH0000863 [Rhizobium etli CIAT 652]